MTVNETPRNTFKQALREGRAQIGIWSSLASPIAAEILAGAGFDWIVIDGEHAPNDVPQVAEQLRAVAAAGQGRSAAVVRPPWNDLVIIKRMLDIGAQSLLIPFVETAAEAARAVSAMRYPPQGVRGVAAAQRANRYGRATDYFTRVHDELCLIVQIETRRAVAAIEEIAAVDGVDALFFGPSDLAADLGQLGNPRHPDVQAALEAACERARRAGKPAGTLAPVEADAQRYLAMGFSFVAVGTDITLLRNGSDHLRRTFTS